MTNKIDNLDEKVVNLVGWTIEGAGGKGGGGGGSTEATNTLRSDSTIRVQEVISEGPIQGLHTGDAQSIFFDNTPLKNADGSTNYYNFSWDFRSGLASQSVMAGFPDIESTHPVGVTITHEIPSVRTVSSASIDSVRVTMNLVNGLFVTNTKNGDINGNSINYAIDTKLTSGTNWTNVATLNKTGKCMSAYEWDILIPRPPGTTTQWDIRVRRIDADSIVSTSVNTLQWAAYTEIQNIQETYPHSAYVGIAVDAQSTNGSIPTRSYLVDGLLIQYPSNYTPGYYNAQGGYQPAVYSGPWNGTFTTGFCNNTAWVLYDMLTNVRYGLGEWIKEEDIDIYSFYAAAVYNDTPVSNQAGGYEPLYQFNGVINSQDDSLKLLTAIAGAMGANIVIQGGLIKISQDRPGSPVKLVTKDTVKDGLFTYSSTNLQTRYTACDVIWNDPSLNYLQNTAHFESTGNAGIIQELGSDQIATFGYNSNQIAGYGCTTYGQAHRLALYSVYTSLVQNELVAWTSSYNAMDLEVGDVVNLFDEDYAQQAGAGKIKAISGTTVTLDRPVVLNGTNTITFVDTNGFTLTTLNISQSNTTTNVITVSAPPNAAVVGHDFVITSAISARPFRIMSIKAGSENNSVDITAHVYDANKYLFVTGQALQPTGQYSAELFSAPTQPTGLNFIPQQVNDPILGAYANLFVNWDSQNNQNGFFQYQASWRKDNSNWSPTIYTNINSFTIERAVQGTYEVQLKAVNLAGIVSPSAVSNYVFGYAGTNTLLPPTSITLQDGHGTGSNWAGNDMYIKWGANAQNVGQLNQTLGGYHIQIWNNDTAQILGNYHVDANTTNFVYMYADNKLQNAGLGHAPCRNLLVKLWTQDAFGNDSSTDIQALFHHPAPAAPSLTLVGDGNGGAWVDFISSGDTSTIVGYKGFWKATNDITWQTGTMFDLPVVQLGTTVGTGTQTVGPATVDVPLPLPQNADGSLYGATFYFLGTAYDEFSSDPAGLNISGMSSVNVGPTYVAAAQLIAGSVTASKLAAHAVGAAALNIPAIDSAGNLAANSVGPASVANSAITAAKLSVAAIDPASGNLTANSVTTAQIVAGTIVGSDIAASTITGTNILANTITTDKLLVGSLSNMAPNGTFSTGDFTGWTYADTPAKWSVDAASLGYNGGKYSALVAAPGGAVTTSNVKFSDNLIQCSPGDVYYFGVRAYLALADTKTQAVVVLKVIKDDGSITYPTVGTASSATAYTLISGQYVVQANDVSVQIGIQGLFNIGGVASATNQKIYFSDAQALRVSSAVLIQDGSITAGKIVAGTITGDKIAANTITGSLIQAGTIVGSNLATTSAIITGTAQIQSGVIVDAHIANLNATKITTGTLNAANVNVVNINASNINSGTINAGLITLASAANMLQNPGFEAGMFQWVNPGNYDTATSIYNGAGASWAVTGNTGATISMHQILSAGQAATYLYQNCPGKAGTTYMASAYTGAHRCQVYVNIDFLDAAGNALDANVTNYAGDYMNNQEASGGQYLAGYKRVWRSATAPAGTMYVRIIIVKNPTINANGNTDSWMFMLKPMLCEIPVGQTIVPPWNNSGTTVVAPGNIQTGTLSALTGNMGNLTAGTVTINNDGGSNNYGYVRSASKWWADGGQGWIAARESSVGNTFVDIQGGSSRFWMSNWGDCGISFPRFSVDNAGNGYFSGSLAANIVNTSNVVGASLTRQWSGVGGKVNSTQGVTYSYNPSGGNSTIMVVYGGSVGGWDSGDRGSGAMIQGQLNFITSAYGGKAVTGGGSMYTSGMYTFSGVSGGFAFRVDGSLGNWDFAFLECLR